MGTHPSSITLRPIELFVDAELVASSGEAQVQPGIPQHAAATGPSDVDRRLIVINLAAVVLPFLGLAAAIVLLGVIDFSWVYPALLVTLAAATALGVTVGFHRLCTHRSFKAPKAVRFAFAALGSMAVQGSVIRWCADHRRHHQHSDEEGDPHSPHVGRHRRWSKGVISTLRGAYHAHLGWLVEGRKLPIHKYARDLMADPVLVRVDRQFPFWVAAGLLLPTVIGGLATMSWLGALMGFLWGGMIRVLLVHHITWSVNSICHLWGTRPFDSHDHSRNNPLVGILALGEGWHNNHHAFPASARHGLAWWQLDVSYMVIRVLAALRLASEVRLPNPQRVQERRRRAARPAPVLIPEPLA